MTETDRLAEIRARAEVASEGPWEARLDPHLLENDPWCYWVNGHDHGALDSEGDLLEEDAEFIAHARTDIPYLLDYIEELKAERADWQRQAKARGLELKDCRKERNALTKRLTRHEAYSEMAEEE